MAELLQDFGKWLQAIGITVMPYSFAMYFPVRWLEYIWQRGYTRLVKAVWYSALGLSYLTGGLGAGAIVTYVCFIEACDLVFQQLEISRDRKNVKQMNGT